METYELAVFKAAPEKYNSMEIYFTALRSDGPYYMKRGQFTFAPHQAAMMTEDVGQKIAKRYGLRVEQESGYQIHYQTFEDLGEPETSVAIESAVRLAKRDGLTNDEMLAIVSKVLEN